MSMDLRVPPLVGTYGRTGTGKTSDKIRAFPRAYFFASPGGLIPAISEVGITPKFEELNQVADLDTLRARADLVLKKDKTIKEFVIDDFSMIAARSERTLKKTIRDGRQLYGALKEKTGTLFDDWRNYGITVAVDCHEAPPTWKTSEEGVELVHTTENRISAGMPNLPGRQSAPEMVKAFDIFYRVVQAPMQLGSGSGDWIWRYKAGPWGDGAEWETKDRWSVARGSNNGVLPLNLGEILRFLQRKYKTDWKISRPVGFEKDEELVAWATEQLKTDPSGTVAFANIARSVLGMATQPLGIDPVKRIKWIVRDARARAEIEALHDQTSLLRELGINL